ncbi:hypothetical protein [Burkholderia diffusa]|uniref:hypothetical protein n=1 Tax=Burkholderia diffusa TaxID=488732 RepID=UPI0015888BA8|nr:hypothetical protein [Burkholderia diffusa]
MSLLVTSLFRARDSFSFLRALLLAVDGAAAAASISLRLLALASLDRQIQCRADPKQ